MGQRISHTYTNLQKHAEQVGNWCLLKYRNPRNGRLSFRVRFKPTLKTDTPQKRQTQTSALKRRLEKHGVPETRSSPAHLQPRMLSLSFAFPLVRHAFTLRCAGCRGGKDQPAWREVLTKSEAWLGEKTTGLGSPFPAKPRGRPPQTPTSLKTTCCLQAFPFCQLRGFPLIYLAQHPRGPNIKLE